MPAPSKRSVLPIIVIVIAIVFGLFASVSQRDDTPRRAVFRAAQPAATVAIDPAPAKQSSASSTGSCRADIAELVQYGATLGPAYQQLSGDLDRGDLAAAQSTYNTIGWLTRDVSSRFAQLAHCRSEYPDAMHQAETAVADSKSSWTRLRTDCTTALAPIGFTC